MATYQQLYERALEEATAKGGTSDEMDAIVAELNALGGWRYRPSERYRAWIAALSGVACEDCSDAFDPEGVPEIKDDALCARCRERKAPAEEQKDGGS